jgi:hypothetical protein
MRGVETGMRALRALFAAVVAALSLVVIGAAPSFACSCVGGDAADFAGRASVVVSGTVTDVLPPPKQKVMSSMDPATYVVDVDQVFKGEAAPTVEVLSPISGASCGLENVEPGRRYVVFASHQSMEGNDPDRLWANLCGGTGPATPKLLAAVQEVTGAPTTAAYGSELAITFDEPTDEQPSEDDWLAGWALPIGLVAGGSLVLLTAVLWVRHALR